jgi:hypothetical protein
MKKINLIVLLLFPLVIFSACTQNELTSTTSTTSSTSSSTSVSLPTSLIQPADLTYLGAFRLPDGTDVAHSWTYTLSGNALTYYPSGDSTGGSDGFPGSLFGTGHSQYLYVSEISIPTPVISVAKSLADLNTATTLQDFQNIKGALFSTEAGYDQSALRVGLEYLPKQGSQTTDKLYSCWGQHFQLDETNSSHIWSELTLSSPHTAGPWRIGSYQNYVTNGYIFEIPDSWANTYTPGKYLGTGRFRDGGQGAQGPALIAYGPWTQGNPPAVDTILNVTPLLLYDPITTGSHTLNGYHNSDEWTGGAWLTTSTKAAVIFVGTKGTGECWYGSADGRVYAEGDPHFEDQGWWSTTLEGVVLFYNPTDLAAVASGSSASYAPQPYAVMKIDSYLYHYTSTRQKNHISDVAFDRTHGLLYMMEPLADGDKGIIHVFRVN